MTTLDRRPRRPQRIPAWVDVVADWVGRGADGITTLLFLFGVVAAIGFGYVPVDLADRNRAEGVAAQGRWVTVTGVEVHVNYVSGRGGGYFEVDNVRAQIPGTLGWTVLDNVESDMDVEDAQEGWQVPTEVTGYQPPFEVRHVANERGEVSAAIARKDLDYWTHNNADPEIGLALGFGGLALILVALGLNNVRLNRIERRRGLPTKRRDRIARRRHERVAAAGRRGRR